MMSGLPHKHPPLLSLHVSVWPPQVHAPPFLCPRPAQVFMDAVNRRVATETLLQFAMAKDEFQYIFLTPQVCVGGQGDMQA